MTAHPANAEPPNRAPSTDHGDTGCASLLWLLVCDAIFTLLAHWAGSTAFGVVLGCVPGAFGGWGRYEWWLVPLAIPFSGVVLGLFGWFYLILEYPVVLACDFVYRSMAGHPYARQLFTALFCVGAGLFLMIFSPKEQGLIELYRLAFFLTGLTFAAVSAWLLKLRRDWPTPLTQTVPPRSLS